MDAFPSLSAAMLYDREIVFSEVPDYDIYREKINHITSFSIIEELTIVMVDHFNKSTYITSHNRDCFPYFGEMSERYLPEDYLFTLVSNEDKEYILSMNKAINDCMRNDFLKGDNYYYFEFDVKLSDASFGESVFLFKVYPYRFTPDNKPWLVNCVISKSNKEYSKSLILHAINQKQTYKFIPELNNFQEANLTNYLNDREIKIIRLSAEGYSESEIISETGMTMGMLKFCKSNIFNKMKVKTTAEAITIAFKNHLLENSDPFITTRSVQNKRKKSSEEYPVDDRQCHTFITTKDIPESDIEELKRICAIFSEVNGIMSVLFDHRDRTLKYLCDSYTEFTGISQEDADMMGIKVHKFTIHKKDFELLYKVHMHTFDVMKGFAKKKIKPKLAAVYNFRLRRFDGAYQHVSCVIRPVYYDDHGMPLVSVLLIKPSYKKGYDRFLLHFIDEEKKFLYSSGRDGFISERKAELKEIEIKILNLTSKGYAEINIADKLSISINLVKYYKRNIFKKMHVESASEAVYIGLLSGII